MNQSTAFGRKILYLVVLVAMLIPLYLFGQPSNGSSGSGGQLATMREDFNIAESDLGEISPTSETMKLVSLGMRGVAATQLWQKAHEYRVQHEWDRLKAALNNIALLQPHYDKVWEHQAHNLAYNVSPQFDDYRQRYEMVREGTEFLTRGVRQNLKAPRLIWYTGWFYGNKMGMSDEKRQFRRLFADDTVLHESLVNQNIPVSEALGPLGKPDNWLVGQKWLEHGYDLVDSGTKIRRQTPLNFFETGPKWAIKHAEAIESEGILDTENAQRAWTKANEDWVELGRRSIETTADFTIKLGSLDEMREQRKVLLEEIRAEAGDVYDQMKAELVDSLQQDMKRVYFQKPEERSPAGKELMENTIEKYLTPNLQELAKRANPENRLNIVMKIAQLQDLGERMNKTEGYRNQINYPYWESLTLAEQEERTIRARRLVYEAEKANADAELDRAIKLYDQAFEIWSEVFDDYPVLILDDAADDLMESVRRYMIAIDSQELPENFPLKLLVEMKMAPDGGTPSAEAYAEIRAEQKEKTAQRKKELEEQERKLLEEAEKAESEKAKAEKMKAEKAETDTAETDTAEEKTGDEKPAKETTGEQKPASEPDAAEATEEKTEPVKQDDASEGESKPEEKPADEPAADEPAAEEPAAEVPAEAGE
ncbi:IRE (iron responsive element) [Stieleria varia]|uniref:IRE (Iron responsive element) n=1 Tax=Stieleria varia TaxID=2528005 RepID=A0A5C5ZWU3_9BACT|nr:IRE (iron responsive element) [Stieleria varia]TWT92084.1 hypothetical protein Pla52n_63810 [Stieleria varia]